MTKTERVFLHKCVQVWKNFSGFLKIHFGNQNTPPSVKSRLLHWESKDQAPGGVLYLDKERTKSLGKAAESFLNMKGL